MGLTCSVVVLLGGSHVPPIRTSCITVNGIFLDCDFRVKAPTEENNELNGSSSRKGIRKSCTTCTVVSVFFHHNAPVSVHRKLCDVSAQF